MICVPWHPRHATRESSLLSYLDKGSSILACTWRLGFVLVARRISNRRQPQQHSSEHFLAPLSPNEALKTARFGFYIIGLLSKPSNDDAWCVEGHRGRQRLRRERRGRNTIHFSFSPSLLICRCQRKMKVNDGLWLIVQLGNGVPLVWLPSPRWHTHPNPNMLFQP